MFVGFKVEEIFVFSTFWSVNPNFKSEKFKILINNCQSTMSLKLNDNLLDVKMSSKTIKCGI